MISPSLFFSSKHKQSQLLNLHSPIMENTPNNDIDPIPAGRLIHGFRRGQVIVPQSFIKTSQDDKFGYLITESFRSKTPYSTPYTQDNKKLLEDLGRSMLDPTDSDEAARLSTIDSGYTYFGQFADHDLTLDRDSDIDKEQHAQDIINYRTPNLDLDSLYGDGPAIDSFLYDQEQLKFVIGRNEGGFLEFDLPRNAAGIAMIGDPRNDENLFVAQFHLGMLKFHNAVVDQLKLENSSMPNHNLFEEAQQAVRRHYQWALVHDYLRTIVGQDLLNDILANGPKFFTTAKTRKDRSFMPVEFSVAAYRFGHSMIRDRYRFNSTFHNEGFMNAFSFTRKPVSSSWLVHWPSFFSVGDLQAANKTRKINTQVALTMGQLPSIPGTTPPDLFKILSSRNLVRGMALGVPTGQFVAKRMKVKPLTTDQLLRNSFHTPTPDQESHHRHIIELLQSSDGLLLKQTPLWYYILKEAEVLHDGNQLGPVGGRIVAEVFVRLLKNDSKSFLNNPGWVPKYGMQSEDPVNYRIIDMLRFAGMLRIPNIS